MVQANPKLDDEMEPQSQSLGVESLMQMLNGRVERLGLLMEHLNEQSPFERKSAILDGLWYDIGTVAGVVGRPQTMQTLIQALIKIQGDSEENPENNGGFTPMVDTSDFHQSMSKSMLLQRMKHYKGLTEIERQLREHAARQDEAIWAIQRTIRQAESVTRGAAINGVSFDPEMKTASAYEAMNKSYSSSLANKVNTIKDRIRDQLQGYTQVSHYPEDLFVRKTGLIGVNTRESRISSYPPEEILASLLTECSAEEFKNLKLSSVAYRAGKVMRSIQFIFRNGTQSAKFGDIDDVNKVLNLRDDLQITQVTVIRNKLLVGLRFTYANGESVVFQGSNANIEKDGPLVENSFDMEKGERIIGVTVDQDQDRPRRIGFTILRNIFDD